MLEINQKLDAYYDWRFRFLRPYKNGLFVCKDSMKQYNKHLCCSNEHALGMLAAVTCNQQADFDGLFKHYKRFRNKDGLMGFLQSMEKDGVFIPKPHGGGSSSTEADVDIATSLFLAKKKWKYGGQHEHIDYGAEAVDLARCVWKKCFNQETFMPLIGDWAKEGADSFKRVSSGHFILGGYWMLQQEDTERSEQWAQVIERIITVLQEQLAMNPKTGLLANYLVLNGDGKYVPFTGKMCGLDHCGTHNRDSCKIPWRLSNYYALTGDARVKPIMEAQANFFAKKLSHGGIHLVYTLDGISVGKLCYQKNVAAPVRLLFGTLGWNDRYEEMVDKTKDAESWNDSTGYSIDLVCTLQYHGKA